jgi:hypothetical protein
MSDASHICNVYKFVVFLSMLDNNDNNENINMYAINNKERQINFEIWLIS